MQPTLANLELVCQKPNWRTRGSFLARRFARPVALYFTWLLCRTPISANAVTVAALVVGWIAAVCIATPGGLTCGVVGLWIWYVLDHVDGQLARWRRTQSVTGIYLDFMMHHLVHPVVAFAIGYGLAVERSEVTWSLAGAGFAFGTMALSIANDCRYKAMHAARSAAHPSSVPFARCDHDDLPPFRQSLESMSTSINAQTAGSNVTRLVHHVGGYLAKLHRCLLGACEIPNVILGFSAVAVASRFDAGVTLRIYTIAMAILSPALAVLRVGKQVWHRVPDYDFAAEIDAKPSESSRPAA